MSDYLVVTLLASAVVGIALGVLGHRIWLADQGRKKRRPPAKWHLQARPLLSDAECEVWHWLQRAFFEYDVLVKVQMIRFMAPRSTTEGRHAHDLLKDLYCTFTICSVEGTVIGCVDLPGPKGLKASIRDLKQTLFEECGLPYAVVRASNLPALEAMRAAFLGEVDLKDDDAPITSASVPASIPVAEAVVSSPVVVDKKLEVEVAAEALLTKPEAVQPARATEPKTAAQLAEDALHVDMLAVIEARKNLRDKLDRNRKIRFTNFDPLSTGTGIVNDNADPQIAVQWEDSFIMSEGAPQEPESKSKR
jgi:hypothetical protein